MISGKSLVAALIASIFIAAMTAEVSAAQPSAPEDDKPLAVEKAMETLEAAVEKSDRKIAIKSIDINTVAETEASGTESGDRSGPTCTVTAMVELADKPIRVSATAATCEAAVTVISG